MKSSSQQEFARANLYFIAVAGENDVSLQVSTQTVRKGQSWKSTPEVDGWYRAYIMKGNIGTEVSAIYW